MIHCASAARSMSDEVAMVALKPPGIAGRPGAGNRLEFLNTGIETGSVTDWIRMDP